MRKLTPAVVSHMFTVRLWFEDLGDGRHEWRGEVREVSTGHQHFFRDWDGMTGFFKVACAAFGPEAPVGNLKRVE